MMTLSQEEKGLPQKISDDIIALILEENLKPGDKLPMKPFSRNAWMWKKFSPGSHEASGLPKHCHRPPGIRNLYRPRLLVW